MNMNYHFKSQLLYRTQRKAGKDWYMQDSEGYIVEVDWLLFFLEFLVFV